ncbi:MAG: glycosyltransferase family 39 protein [Chloroflexota bacterium]
MLEPPGRDYHPAIPLYVAAVVLTGWAGLAQEWKLPSLPPHQKQADPLTARVLPVLLSIPFILAAFWQFGGGRFTFVNLTLWLIAVSLLLYGLWLKPSSEPMPARDENARLRSMIWFMLLIAAFGFLIFFRLNHIDEVPGQPFSDHAEKILDVYDLARGETKIFFERNTGREAFQMYWTWLIARIFGTGLSFLTLKLGTALLGILTLPFIYLLGKEYATPRTGLFAMILFGIGYWPNVIARMGLRFPLYPLFLAPTLLFLTRGLRTRSRTDFLLCGIFLGLGLHGYTPFRIVPLLVVIAFALYIMHVAQIANLSYTGQTPALAPGAHLPRTQVPWSVANLTDVRQALWWLLIVAIVSLVVVLPLLRYALDHFDTFSLRAFSRVVNAETDGPPLLVFFSNLQNGLLMFNWDDGNIWVNSLTNRPALDVVTAALFVLGIALLSARYFRQFDWRDLFLLISIPVLLMPSVLSLAFPMENPSLNRAGGAAVIVALFSGLALDGLVSAFICPGKSGCLSEERNGSALERLQKTRLVLGYGVTGILLAVSAFQNYDLVFRQFNASYLRGVWNTSEMGNVIEEFRQKYGKTDTVWIVPYSQWVDTRLPGMWIGIPDRDFALWPDKFAETAGVSGPKLFIFHPFDEETEKALKDLYPDSLLSRYTLLTPGKDFMVLFVEE